MELDTLDALYVAFIVIVVLAGIICLLIFLPKEHDLEDKTSDCYRISMRNGVYTISNGKAGLWENIYSLGTKFTYIKRIPFHVDAFFDDDESDYRAAAKITVFFPEDRLNIFAPTFAGSNHESICETISETASVALKEALEDYGSSGENDDALKERFKVIAADKLALFGVELTLVNEVRAIKQKNR